MKIAYASILSAEDPNTWSGLNRSIADCLRELGFEVTLLQPLYDARRAWVSKVRAQARTLATGKRHLWSRDQNLLRHYGRELARQLECGNFDWVFSPGTEAIAYLPESVTTPVAFWTDSPFGPLVNYYAWYTGLAPQAVAEATETDTLALQRARLACYSSAWAADAAASLHHAAREKLVVLPFGPNLDSSVAETEIPELVRQRLGSPWRFLFVGVDWTRKGGDIALAVVQELNRLGFPSELDVVGCQPPTGAASTPAWVRLHGFVNRGEESGRRQLTELFRKATFFLLPSQAEAFGVVFPEAAAHALPILATRTGGIPSAVTDGVSGFLFSPAAAVSEYVNRIRDATAPLRYAALSRAAYADSVTRLNWRASGCRLQAALEARLPRRESLQLVP